MTNSNRERTRLPATALIVAGLLLVGVCPAAWAAEYYIDPNGDPNGLGTIGDPWSIAKLDDPTSASGGDTIYLRGGTYYYPTRDDGHLGFRFDLRGDPNNKITIMPYEDEKPVIDGGLTSTYREDCEHVRLYGLEVIVSEWYDPNNRISTESGSWPLDLDAPYGGIELGDGTGIDVINCYIHHFNHNGIGWRDQNGYNAEIHGTVIYNGGWIGPDRNHGHSVYGANTTDSPRLMDQTYCFEIMSSNMHVWGSYSSDVSDITWRHNVMACHTDVTLNQTTANYFGGANPDSGYLTLEENLFYMSSATFGYDGATSGGGHHYTVTDNTFIRGKMRWWEGTWSNVVTSGNVIWWDDEFSGRQYHDMGGLPEWTDPPIVDFHINRYDSNRANLCLIQPTKYDPDIQPIDNTEDGNDTISVDFSSWLTNGDVVNVQDARDLYGDPVYTFTYSGSSVNVPVATTGPIGDCKEFSLYVCFKAAGGNTAPTVDAGSNANVELPTDTTSLDGTVADDGEPTPATLTQTWSKDAGPGTVTFTNANAADTTATFSAAGTYVLKLTANDTALTTSDTVTITVYPANTAPTVDAGSNDSITLPDDDVNLDGTVADDGLPLAGNLTQTWSKDSGPGTVTFANANAVDTTATFSTDGTYVLKLTAEDGALTTTDTVQITVNPTGNAAPTVNAGADDQITWPDDDVSLDGTVTDDGLPDPPDAVTTTWSKDSGPGTVTFANANAVDTTATFSTIGTYVLQLLADDSALTATDTVTIQVVEAGSTVAVLFDMGSNDVPNTPETDGRYYNYLGRAETANAWDTIVDANAVDEDNTITGVGLDVYDIANQNKNLAKAGTYPYNVENDGWNYASAEGSQAIIRITGLDDQETYTLKIHSAWPSDPWWYASGQFTCQGTSYYYDDDGAVIYTWTDLEPNDGEIDLEMNTWLPEGENPIEGSCFSIELIEVTPESSGNDAPTVDAGSNANVEFPTDTTSLDATVSDDGNPTPATLTQTWSKDSGSGTVTFTDANAADTTATFSDAGTYVLKLTASDGEKASNDTVTITVYPLNVAPIIDAGSNAEIELPDDDVGLDGTVADDGLPLAGSLTQTWSKDSGPGTVTFANANAVDTAATFSAAGTYVLKLTAEDTDLTSTDTVTVTVVQNQAPSVDAGSNDSVTLPDDDVNLDGTVADDGYPTPATLTQTWSKDSGPGTVTFANANAVDTTATFSTDGTYVLKLTANDTALTTTDTVQITVNPASNSAPTVNAGANDQITWPDDDVSLDGTVSDDGNPTPATLTQTWSKDSGPGTVTFANANAVDTTATFSTTGTYVLKLTADDTALTTTDTVTITVQEGAETVSILFDMGANDEPNAPETDGRYYNHLGRVRTPNDWETVVDANAVDEDNTTTGVGLEVYDIDNQNKNLAKAGTYPYNVENDGWNYSSSEGSQAIIRITGLDDQETYTLKIHSAWPSDPWWYASGQFTCQGTSYYYDDDGAVIYTWTDLEPDGGEIDLEMNTWLPDGEDPIVGSVFSIELIELIGPP